MKSTKKIISIILSIVIICSMAVAIPTTAGAATNLPNSVYIQQATNYTCTLASATMMIRARMYLSGNSSWSSVSEASVKPVGWNEGSGLWHNFTYKTGNNSVSVSHGNLSGISFATLKSLLNSHPEGIVLYCVRNNYQYAHAVLVTDYEGDTFYCADPASGYAGTRRTLTSSWLKNCFGSTQSSILSCAVGYWYVSSYSITVTPTGNNPQGCLDSVTGGLGSVTVGGWAFDRDSLGTALRIDVYIGGPTGTAGAECHSITANKSRPDVNNAFSGVGNNHGFQDTISTNKVGSQSVYVYAINVGSGTHTCLGNKNVNINKETNVPKISNVTVSAVTSKGYRVSCNVSDDTGVTAVKFPTWTTTNGQDDLIWHVGSLNSTKTVATFYVKSSDHKNEKLSYVTDIYAYDRFGNSSNTRVEINLIDEPSFVGVSEYNGNTYKVYNSGKSWTEAKEWCEKQGGHLATVTSKGEWNNVKNLSSTYFNTYCWLGAESTSGSWKWVTGESFSFTDWDVNQPDGGDEHYLGTHNTNSILSGDKWNDFTVDSNKIGGFICEFEKTEPVTAETQATKPTEPTTKCNHSNIVTVTYLATYVEKGKKVVSCTNCGKVLSKSSIAKKVLKTPLVKVKSAKKSIKVTLKKKVTGATGFIVKYQEKGKKKVYTKTYNTKKKVTKVISKLKKRKKYTVYVRAYVKSGKKIAYSAWTKPKTVKIK